MKTTEPWYAHPRRPRSKEEQAAWRRAVEEVAEVLREEPPTGAWRQKQLPCGNMFACACGEPTYDEVCALCAADRAADL